MIDHYQQSIFDGTEQSMYNQSIELIKTFEEVALQRNPVGYVVGYSGGKDSDVLVDLFRKSGVKFMVMHNHIQRWMLPRRYITCVGSLQNGERREFLVKSITLRCRFGRYA